MAIPRRTFLALSTLAAAGVAGPVAAWAQRPRVLGAPVPETSASGGGRLPELERAARALRVGPVSRHGGLLVFWLHSSEAPPPLAIATLDEARAAGTVAIVEKSSPRVPEITVENHGKTHVLLLAGEILVGGKQNRVLREDVLLPPLSGPRSIGVYCVEQGRWNEGRRDFESKSTLAQPGLRREVYDKADQGRVWSEVARAARAAGAPSPTSSYQQVYEQPSVRDHLAEAERALDVGALDTRIAAEVVGAAVFADSTLSGLDVFRDSDLFAREWRKLLRAHAVEAYSKASSAGAPEAKLRAEVVALLAAAAAARGLVRGNAGVGQVLEFRVDRHRGAALGHESRLVHVAIV